MIGRIIVYMCVGKICHNQRSNKKQRKAKRLYAELSYKTVTA